MLLCYCDCSHEVNMSTNFQGRKRLPLGNTEVAWKSTGKAKKKWTVAIIDSRSYNFGESREREEWNVIGSSRRKSNPCSLSWHWIFALSIFHLPWGLWWPNAPWPSNQQTVEKQFVFLLRRRHNSYATGLTVSTTRKRFHSISVHRKVGVGTWLSLWHDYLSLLRVLALSIDSPSLWKWHYPS